MAISYIKFTERLLDKGLTLNELKNRGIISDTTYRLMLQDKPINLKYVDKICCQLNLSIEQVVEIIPDEENSD